MRGRCGLGAEQAQCEKERHQAEGSSVRARESASSVAVPELFSYRESDGEEPLFLSERIVKLTRFWRVTKRESLSHGGEGKRKNVRFFFTEYVM